MELIPTRSAVLELQEERAVVSEAYDFLDEKRLLLAAELLRQLQRYETLIGEYERLRLQAARGLADAVARHGLHGLSVYPAASLEAARLRSSERSFMGVTLVETELETAEDTTRGAAGACNPSPEAEHCRRLFAELVKRSAEIAGVSGNLRRLLAEYRKTERRARALENVILPELAQNLHEMTARLEEMDQEDAIRVHLEYPTRSPGAQR